MESVNKLVPKPEQPKVNLQLDSKKESNPIADKTAVLQKEMEMNQALLGGITDFTAQFAEQFYNNGVKKTQYRVEDSNLELQKELNHLYPEMHTQEGRDKANELIKNNEIENLELVKSQSFRRKENDELVRNIVVDSKSRTLEIQRNQKEREFQYQISNNENIKNRSIENFNRSVDSMVYIENGEMYVDVDPNVQSSLEELGESVKLTAAIAADKNLPVNQITSVLSDKEMQDWNKFEQELKIEMIDEQLTQKELDVRIDDFIGKRYIKSKKEGGGYVYTYTDEYRNVREAEIEYYNTGLGSEFELSDDDTKYALDVVGNNFKEIDTKSKKLKDETYKNEKIFKGNSQRNDNISKRAKVTGTNKATEYKKNSDLLGAYNESNPGEPVESLIGVDNESLNKLFKDKNGYGAEVGSPYWVIPILDDAAFKYVDKMVKDQQKSFIPTSKIISSVSDELKTMGYDEKQIESALIQLDNKGLINYSIDFDDKKASNLLDTKTKGELKYAPINIDNTTVAKILKTLSNKNNSSKDLSGEDVRELINYYNYSVLNSDINGLSNDSMMEQLKNSPSSFFDNKILSGEFGDKLPNNGTELNINQIKLVTGSKVMERKIGVLETDKLTKQATYNAKNVDFNNSYKKEIGMVIADGKAPMLQETINNGKFDLENSEEIFKEINFSALKPKDKELLIKGMNEIFYNAQKKQNEQVNDIIKFGNEKQETLPESTVDNTNSIILDEEFEAANDEIIAGVVNKQGETSFAGDEFDDLSRDGGKKPDEEGYITPTYEARKEYIEKERKILKENGNNLSDEDYGFELDYLQRLERINDENHENQEILDELDYEKNKDKVHFYTSMAYGEAPDALAFGAYSLVVVGRGTTVRKGFKLSLNQLEKLDSMKNLSSDNFWRKHVNKLKLDTQEQIVYKYHKKLDTYTKQQNTFELYETYEGIKINKENQIDYDNYQQNMSDLKTLEESYPGIAASNASEIVQGGQGDINVFKNEIEINTKTIDKKQNEIFSLEVNMETMDHASQEYETAIREHQKLKQEIVTLEGKNKTNKSMIDKAPVVTQKDISDISTATADKKNLEEKITAYENSDKKNLTQKQLTDQKKEYEVVVKEYNNKPVYKDLETKMKNGTLNENDVVTIQTGNKTAIQQQQDFNRNARSVADSYYKPGTAENEELFDSLKITGGKTVYTTKGLQKKYSTNLANSVFDATKDTNDKIRYLKKEFYENILDKNIPSENIAKEIVKNTDIKYKGDVKTLTKQINKTRTVKVNKKVLSKQIAKKASGLVKSTLIGAAIDYSTDFIVTSSINSILIGENVPNMAAMTAYIRTNQAGNAITSDNPITGLLGLELNDVSSMVIGGIFDAPRMFKVMGQRADDRNAGYDVPSFMESMAPEFTELQHRINNEDTRAGKIRILLESYGLTEKQIEEGIEKFDKDYETGYESYGSSGTL